MSSRVTSNSFKEGRYWMGRSGRRGGLRKGQPRRSLSPGQVLAILRKVREGARVKTLAREYLLGPSSIYRILEGRTYKEVPRVA